MKRFAQLIQEIDQTNSTTKKVALLADYFKTEPNEKNRLWAIALFAGKKPSRTINTTFLRSWCAEEAGIPLWLFEENYHIIGDLAETISLILPLNADLRDMTLEACIQHILDLKNENEATKKAFIIDVWKSLDTQQLWIFNKLITGGFRIGVSKNIIIQSLATTLDVEPTKIAHLLMGEWSPLNTTWTKLFTFDASTDRSKPYPFYLSYPISETSVSELNVEEWTAEWKWDGIRSQFICRQNEVFLWSRGEELITDKFPELTTLSPMLPSFVIDGEIIAWKNGIPAGFQVLQTRINRKTVSRKALSDTPTILIAYDLLEYDGEDIRTQPFEVRRKKLETMISSHIFTNIILSEQLVFSNIEELRDLRSKSREYFAEGLMLKRKNGIYHTGRKSGDMWKWKIDPFSIDAVMLYAQRGHGRRANLYSDFTFALWEGGRLVPFAKAYSGLTDEEMTEITKFVKANTIETFGPVCSVKPELVFEIAFEGISLSSRHKAGIAVRFPRISSWRKDKKASEANELADLKKLI